MKTRHDIDQHPPVRNPEGAVFEEIHQLVVRGEATEALALCERVIEELHDAQAPPFSFGLLTEVAVRMFTLGEDEAGRELHQVLQAVPAQKIPEDDRPGARWVLLSELVRLSARPGGEDLVRAVATDLSGLEQGSPEYFVSMVNPRDVHLLKDFPHLEEIAQSGQHGHPSDSEPAWKPYVSYLVLLLLILFLRTCERSEPSLPPVEPTVAERTATARAVLNQTCRAAPASASPALQVVCEKGGLTLFGAERGVCSPMAEELEQLWAARIALREEHPPMLELESFFTTLFERCPPTVPETEPTP